VAHSIVVLMECVTNYVCDVTLHARDNHDSIQVEFIVSWHRSKSTIRMKHNFPEPRHR